MRNTPEAYTILTHEGFAMYGLHSKLVCLYKMVKVIDNRKYTRLPRTVNCKSVMFYSTGPSLNCCTVSGKGIVL